MKKCTHCGYKNADTETACNLCHNRLPKEVTRERPAPGAADNEPFHEPRKWTGSGPPARIERGPRAFDLGGGVTSTGGSPAGSAPAGSAPAAPAAPRADVNTERHFLVPPTGDIVRLEVGKTATMGRDAGCTVKIASGKVSRRHCEIRWEGTPAKPVVHDLGSQNGTYVNERKLESRGKHALQDGEEIEIGDVKQKYRCLAPGVSENELRETSGATIVAQDEVDDAGLTGNAALLPIGEVLRRLEALRASGTLEVEVGGNVGRVELHGGKATAGTYAGLEGGAAVTAVAALKTGRFRFDQVEGPSDATPAPAPGPGGKAIPAPPLDSTAAQPQKAPRPPKKP